MKNRAGLSLFIAPLHCTSVCVTVVSQNNLYLLSSPKCDESMFAFITYSIFTDLISPKCSYHEHLKTSLTSRTEFCFSSYQQLALHQFKKADFSLTLTKLYLPKHIHQFRKCLE